MSFLLLRCLQDFPLCNLPASECFDYFTRVHAKQCEDNCMPDCESVDYSWEEKEKPLDVKNLCRKNSGKLYRNVVSAQFQRLLPHLNRLKLARLAGPGSITYGLMDAVINNYTEFQPETIESVASICERVAETEIATVRIKMRQNTFSRTEIKLRHTFSDKLSSFGTG